MDFRTEVERLLRQIPRGSVARCADLARALGDVRASMAISRFVHDHPDVPGADRLIIGSGRPAANKRFFTDFQARTPLARLREEQIALASEVSRKTGFKRLETIGGVDVSYEGDRGFAALVVLRARGLEVVEEVLVSREVAFPYIPTYLAYREWPLIEAAMDRVTEPPTVLLVDGHGQLHPARCGIACLVGVRLDLPTIGVAKNPLVGMPRGRPPVGGSSPIVYEGEVLGHAFRPSRSARYLYVSIGHRVAPGTAVRIVRLISRAGHPAPLRLAHIRATDWKRRQGKM